MSARISLTGHVRADGATIRVKLVTPGAPPLRFEAETDFIEQLAGVIVTAASAAEPDDDIAVGLVNDDIAITVGLAPAPLIVGTPGQWRNIAKTLGNFVNTARQLAAMGEVAGHA